MTTGITRDETLAKELINLLFCKIYDELNTPPEQEVAFRAGVNEDPKAIKERINKLFEDKVKKDEYEDVFDSTDNITLDPESLYYVVGELQNYCISEAERDAIADAFEVFIGPALRGPEGQFFTPRNVIKMMVEIIDPNAREMIIDPACGSGGFLIVALEHVWSKLDIEAAEKEWSRERRRDVKKDVARKFFRGIDKDSFLTKVTKAYMALVGDGRGGVFCENTLRHVKEWQSKARDTIQFGKFDVLLTNPPFGSKIPVKGDAILGQYSLGHEWKKSKDIGIWEQTQKMKEKKPPQILFIERSLQLLKDGGRMGIVLPESIFGNPSHGYILKYLLDNIKIIGIVSMPEDLFQPYTHAKTCVVFIEKIKPSGDYPIFMSVVRWCGHDSRGNQIPHDEVPQVSTRYYELMKEGKNEYNRLGFIKHLSELKSNILIPKYYDPDIDEELGKLSELYDLKRFDDFVNSGILEVSTGDEIGKLSYSTGNIPFIRSSDISNWELKIDPKQRVSKDIFDGLKDKQNVKEHDILLVRDGTYLIGTTCMITKYNIEMLYQSHIYKIRSLDHEILSPYLLLAILNSPIVKRQIRSKQFTQDIIDTLGNRLMELVLPIPKDKGFREEIEQETKLIIDQRAELRQKTLAIPLRVLRKEKLTEDEEKIINE